MAGDDDCICSFYLRWTFILFFLFVSFATNFTHILAIYCGASRIAVNKRTKSKTKNNKEYPGVSVIKPLTGAEPYLVMNLESYFKIQYPKMELMFCFHRRTDPALPTVEKLRKKYPDVNAEIFIASEDIGVNPKVNNMYPAYKASKYDLVLFSDSGIYMKHDTLTDMVDHMHDGVGLVHQMPFVLPRPGFLAALEKMYFGTMHSRYYLSSYLLGLPCTNGMSNLIRKSALEQLGGLKHYSRYLAEDYFMARDFVKNGWKLEISSQMAWQNSGYTEVRKFNHRFERWFKLRMKMLPALTVLEPLSECLMLGIGLSWALHYLFNWNPYIIFVTHVTVRFCLDLTLFIIVQDKPFSLEDWQYLPAWIYREVICTFLYVHSYIDPIVFWRTGYFRIFWGGLSQQVYPHKKTS